MEKPKVTNTIAIMVIWLIFGYLFIQLFLPIPDNNKDMVNIINGALLTGLAGVLAFYFSSSKGGEIKNETIKNLSENQKQNP